MRSSPFPGVLVCFSFAVINTMSKSIWGREGFIWLPGYIISSKKARAGAQGGNPEAGTEVEITKDHRLLTCSDTIFK